MYERNQIKKNKLCQPPHWGYIQHVQIITILFQKEQTILIPVKYNHTCKKKINLMMPSRRFSDIISEII